MSNFTPGAQTLLALAQKVAQHYGDNYVGTEHIAVAMMHCATPLSDRTMKFMSDLGLNMQEIRSKCSQTPLTKEEKRVSISDFKPGVKVRGKSTGTVFTVTDNYGDRATAIRTQDITNPSEWEIID